MSVLLMSGLSRLTALRLVILNFRNADMGLLGANGCFFALLFGTASGVGINSSLAIQDKGNMYEVIQNDLLKRRNIEFTNLSNTSTFLLLHDPPRLLFDSSRDFATALQYLSNLHPEDELKLANTVFYYSKTTDIMSRKLTPFS